VPQRSGNRGQAADRHPDDVGARYQEVREQGVQVLTIGQYLRPSGDQLPVSRFYTPDEFAALKREGMRLGIRHVESGPLVRSSYHAHEQVEALSD